MIYYRKVTNEELERIGDEQDLLDHYTSTEASLNGDIGDLFQAPEDIGETVRLVDVFAEGGKPVELKSTVQAIREL